MRSPACGQYSIPYRLNSFQRAASDGRMLRQITMGLFRRYGISYGELPYRAASVTELQNGANAAGWKPTPITTEPS